MGNMMRRLYFKAANQKVPLTGAFEVSPVCNFQCKMCYVRKSSREVEEQGGVQPLEFWLDVARQAKEAGTVFPLLTGGEPFLYPHIRELYEAMCKMGMQVSFNSNASQISEEVISWLREMPPTQINITLYGGCNETYERLCGDPKGFDKVKRGVQLLRDNGIRFKFNCSLTPDNCGDLEQMLAFAKSYDLGLRVATYMFPPVRRTGQCGDYSERFTPQQAAYYHVLTDWYQLPREQFQRIAANAQHFRELTPEQIAEAERKAPREMACLSGRCSYWVDWQGRLSGCGMIDIPTISLKESSLADAWSEIVKWTDELRYSPVCGNCVNRTVCYACAAMVHNETGGFIGRPEYLCEMRKFESQYYREFLERIPREERISVESFAEYAKLLPEEGEAAVDGPVSKAFDCGL